MISLAAKSHLIQGWPLACVIRNATFIRENDVIVCDIIIILGMLQLLL